MMKLFYSAQSPFARKVRVLIAEKAIANVALITVSPFEKPPELLAVNPLSKVPSLLLDDGMVLYDSRVICEFLDSLDDSAHLIPAHGQSRWTALRRHALADGLMDTTLLLALEVNRRPEHERSPQWIDRWCTTIRQTVDALESEIEQLPEVVDISHIAIGCALAYLDFRAADHVSWRDHGPRLAKWFTGFEQRPAMQTTRPE
jgi:glutathione S-transferase